MSNQSELDEILALNMPIDENHQRDKANIKQAFLDWHNKQVRETVHGFHGYIMESNIIRNETDQAFNYARLHAAIDNYIGELKESSNDRLF